jgi:hypothetical protein
LQERAYPEAAKNVGLPAGTVSSRLARARDLLRVRLLRRGLTLSSSLLVSLLAQQTLSAAVPRALRTSTTEAALRIVAGQTVLEGLVSEPVAASTKEMLQAMFVTKLQATGLLLLVVGALGAASVRSRGAWSEKRIDAPEEETPAPTGLPHEWWTPS